MSPRKDDAYRQLVDTLERSIRRDRVSFSAELARRDDDEAEEAAPPTPEQEADASLPSASAAARERPAERPHVPLRNARPGF